MSPTTPTPAHWLLCCLCSVDLTNTSSGYCVSDTSMGRGTPGAQITVLPWWEGRRSGHTGRPHPPGSLDSPPGSATPSRPPTCPLHPCPLHTCPLHTCPLHTCPGCLCSPTTPPPHPPRAVISHHLLTQKLTPHSPACTGQQTLHPLPLSVSPSSPPETLSSAPPPPTPLLS